MKGNEYSKVLKTEKQYKYMLIANIISRFGDSIDAIAYSWMVYQITGSKSWLAFIMGVNMVPTVLLQPFGGALTGFLNKKHIMVVCDFIRGGIVLLTGLLFLGGLLKPWHLLLMTLLNSTVEALRVPTGLAILPQILQKENYKAAISLNQSSNRTAELIGMGCAGVIIGIIGVGGALFVDAVTFFASAILLAMMRIEMEKARKKEFQIRDYTRSLKEGLVYFKQSDIAILVTIICAVLNFIILPIENLKAAYISEYLRLDVMAMSVGGTALTIGMIAGALFLPFVLKKISDRVLLSRGGFFIGIIYAAYLCVGMLSADSGKYLCYFAVSFMFGFMVSLMGAAVNVLLITAIPDELLGLIGGLFNSLACASTPLGSFVLAAAASVLSISQIYGMTAVLSILAFAMIGKQKEIKALDHREAE